jgi:hypothetical protein
MAIAAMIKMIATTINNSIKENPLTLLLCTGICSFLFANETLGEAPTTSLRAGLQPKPRGGDSWIEQTSYKARFICTLRERFRRLLSNKTAGRAGWTLGAFDTICHLRGRKTAIFRFSFGRVPSYFA